MFKSLKLFYKLQPTIHLLRLHQPWGALLLWVPCLWILPYTSYSPIWYLVTGIGALSMRSFGCIVNDLVDRKIDPLVHRSCLRPLAQGTVRIPQAIFLAFLIVLPSLSIFQFLSIEQKYSAVLSLPMIILYPFFKRWTFYPQVFLGLTFNMPIWIIGFNQAPIEQLFYLYCSGVFYTILYDTVYGFMDYKDDKKVGVKSMSIRFLHMPKKLILILFIVTVGFSILSLRFDHWLTGYLLFLFVIVSLLFIYQWEFDDPLSCYRLSNYCALGGVFLGVIHFLSIFLIRNSNVI